MIQPTDKISLELEAQQWQQVVEVLCDGRFRTVMPLIQEIQKQLMAHSQQDNRAATRVPSAMNGSSDAPESSVHE
jgi:hypothetical protein